MENTKSSKLRLLLFTECNRNCEGCCNKDWDLPNLPVCTDFSGYELIMLTGGEPMLHPDIVRSETLNIRMQTLDTNTKIILYTAMTEGLDDIMPFLDGVTLTLHDTSDISKFEQFDRTAKNLDGKSLRLNVFAEAGSVNASSRWSVKSNIEWIENCPLPNGEDFMRI